MAWPSSRHKITLRDWDFNPNAVTRREQMVAHVGAATGSNCWSNGGGGGCVVSTAATETFAMAAGFNFPAPSTANLNYLRDENNFQLFRSQARQERAPFTRAVHATTQSPQGGRGGDVCGAKTPPTKSHRPRRRQTRQACRGRGELFLC